VLFHISHIAADGDVRQSRPSLRLHVTLTVFKY